MPKKLAKSGPAGGASFNVATGVPAAVYDPNAPQTLDDGLPLPKLFVFDLDYTLWPLWVDTHVTPPLKSHDNGKAVADSSGSSKNPTTYSFYPAVPGILYSLRLRGIPTGIASRTHRPDLAREMLRLLYVQPSFSTNLASLGSSASNAGNDVTKPTRAYDFFSYFEIFPDDKTTHFENLKGSTGIEYEDMIFFDDEIRNEIVQDELGVAFKLVQNGVTKDEIDSGIKYWRKRRGLSNGA